VATWQTWIWQIFLYHIGIIGVTAGAHRFWTHRAYKAILPARILLLLFHTVALQFDVIYWAQEHRLHHKYVDTDGDPHNSRRGLFFSHMGWILLKTHPVVAEKEKILDLSDLTSDPLLQFQRKYYKTLAALFGFIIPAVVPWYFWGEPLYVGFLTAGLLRYTIMLHATWSVNSFAHAWGHRPYDKNIKPSEISAVSMITLGEGWHNYHHVFPYDYKAAEFGWKWNISTQFIDFLAAIGWAYDRKTASPQAIAKQKRLHGEGENTY